MTEVRQAGPERTPDGRRLRWAEHRVQRRAAFVAAGAVAVDEHGPDASAEQIAAAAGVSRTVLYRYFRDREDLRQAIADHVVNAIVDSVVPHLALGRDSTPRQIIGSAVGVIVGWFDEHPNLYFFLRARRTGLDAVENTLADRVSDLLRVVLLLLGLDEARAEPNAFAIVGMVESIGAWWLARRTLSREQVTEVVCDGIWHLLDGTARASGVALRYDEPLPWNQLESSGAGA
ncbi:TetR/AcrR family transcriptional regulator [Jatrophihabitans cynanchi]|uniref:TetR/AcrR family transcriptional regulator n=1 Tax=Jatrophihabitans cynanchi TaxID=2944128 RepID=A0ABY7K326_9ACTN|nr:TetR/AcrR family transcriptional regulator [Jatrophihabitans sp. SB3-54]WAX58908.1 TetR/AcrR family transcriptional regulator [Jatrophihabitans sp. SB3-54]